MEFEKLTTLKIELLFCKETSSYYVSSTSDSGGVVVRVGTEEKNTEPQMFGFFDEIVIEAIEKTVDTLRDWND